MGDVKCNSSGVYSREIGRVSFKGKNWEKREKGPCEGPRRGDEGWGATTPLWGLKRRKRVLSLKP